MRTIKTCGKLKRALAALLCWSLIMPLIPQISLPARSAETDKSYEEEKAARLEEYNEKFDLEKLTWSTTNSMEGGSTTYGKSARTYMCWAGGDFGGIAHKNYIHVFAFEGETITFGSSVANSTLDIAGTGALSANPKDQETVERQLGEGATVDIVLIDLDGNRIPYNVEPNGKGHIPNVQTEVLAKTMEEVGGKKGSDGSKEYEYTPLTYTVHETGVYTFEFHSQDGSGTDTNARQKKNGTFADENGLINNKDCGGMVDAWDISVFNEQGYKETGRVYADYLDFQEQGDVNETYYVLTSDSYIYKWDFKGAHPYTYNFFANNQGLLDSATGNILYKSVKELENTFNFTKFGVTYTYPGTPDTELTKSFKIFFEKPDEELEGELYEKAVAPDPASNLKFVTQVWDETSKKYIPGSYVGRGGWFQFDVENATTATLRIEFLNKDKLGKDYAPVEISGVVTPYSTNRFFWDGRDGNGEIIPEGKYAVTDISWTIVTKAGEIHFPIMDVEYTTGGFTFTRVSHVYDKDGNILDADDDSDGATENIYTATRSVIYYDNSAIYYGEHVGITGTPESEIHLDTSGTNKITNRTNWADDTWTTGTKGIAYSKGKFYLWDDIVKKGSEYLAWTSDYRKDHNLRVGDHSHTSNSITYYNEDGEMVTGKAISDQMEMIKWLDSAENPVSISGGTGTTTVSDFGIQNFWTFVPGQPVTATSETLQNIVIKDTPDGQEAADITGLVFYDNDGGKTTGLDGKYNASQSHMDVPLSGVTVNLYRQITKDEWDSGKQYYTVTGTHGSWKVSKSPSTGAFPEGTELNELVKTELTDLEGRVVFENQLYNATAGTKFAYEVVKPNTNWKLTSGGVGGTPLGSSPNQYGNYALYAYDKAEKGTEVQVITLGTGTNMVNPESNLANYTNHTATAIDVGYNYAAAQSLKAVKTWKTKAGKTNPENVVFELSTFAPKATSQKTSVYEEHSLSSIMSWEEAWNYLPDVIDGQEVQYYISAEYYLVKNESGGGTLYKHTFDLDESASDLTYASFVGKAYSRTLTDDEVAALNYGSYDSLNPSGKEWKEEPNAPYTAVLDRNVGTAETVVTVTNSDDPGVIEILKYTGSEDDHNVLSGATFRLYTKTDGNITLDEVKKLVDAEDTAGLAALQVGSGSTRDNGRMTFSGLDPNKHYVIREVYPPAGYRAREVLYIVHPASCKLNGEHYHADRPEDMDDETWDSWQLQNLYFGTDHHASANIANISASGDMAIRKQIEGRAWGDTDAFTFDIAFRNTDGTAITGDVTLTSSGTNYVISDSTAVRIPQEEYDRFKKDSGNSLEGADGLLTNFLKDFNAGTKDLTINNTSAYAEDTVSVNGMQDVKVALSDTKQSVDLIVNDEIIKGTDGKFTPAEPKDALMNTSSSAGDIFGTQAGDAHDFPAAGTYTFTVSENPGNQATTDYTPRVYIITVLVTRVLDPNEESSTPITRDNSYLHAEVQSIYYQDAAEGTDSTTYPTGYSGRAYYAGVAPTFTNRYHIQPAVQSTSYAIQVNFSGRLDKNGDPINKDDITKNWLDTDQFTVTISGDDEITKEALKNGNIYISGLQGDLDDLHEPKRINFNQTNVTNGYNDTETDEVVSADEHLFKFEELDFRDIEFPVKWEFAEDAEVGGQKYEKGSVVPPEDKENGKNFVVTYTAENAPEGLEAGSYFIESAEYQNEPEEHLKDFHKVVSRTEDLVYHLTIAMEKKNDDGITYDTVTYSMTITLKNSSDGSATVDGIIDEMDLVVERLNGTEVLDEKYATCETDQHVVTSFDDWIDPEGYFTGKGLPAPEDGSTVKYVMYYVNNDGVIREAHKDDGGKYYVDRDGTETEINSETFETYRTTYNVTFIVKREAHSGNHTMVFTNTYEATGTWTPTVHKTVSGREWQDGEEFKFELKCTNWPGTGNTYNPLTVPQTIEVREDSSTSNQGAGSFPGVTFHCPGEYTFTITETGTGAGLGKGDKPASITITVKAEDDNKGGLNLTVTGEDGTEPPEGSEKTSTVATTVNFVNAYSESGEFKIAIAKTLTGRNWNAGESFTFTVTPDDAAKAAIKAEKLNMPTGWTRNSDGTYTVTVTATNNGQGTLTLGNHEGKGATYVFTVEEKTDTFDRDHLYCAQPKMVLTVLVTSETVESGYTGALMTYAYLVEGTEENYVKDGSYTVPFTNKYYVDTDAPGVTPTTHGFTVEKSFTGRPDNTWLPGDTFTATVTYVSGDLENMLYKNGGKYEAIDGTFNKDITFTSTDHAPKTFDFRFYEAGEYVFKVTEKEESIPGVTYDSHTYTVTLTVTLVDNNTLKVTSTVSDGANPAEIGNTVTLKNTYAASGTWTPSVTKTLEGRDWQENEKFKFTLTYDGTSDGVELPTKTTVEVGEDESVPFDAVKFTKPGEYTFTITETRQGEGLGIGGPQGDITLTVKAEDNGDGTLNISVTGEGGRITENNASSAATTTVTFVNTYDESGSFDFKLSKLLTGRKWTDDDEFTFTITPDDAAKAAITAGTLTVPGAWTSSGDNYTVTVKGTDPGTAGEGGWVTKTLDMGSLTVGNLGGKRATYVFTVTESNEGFEDKHLTCTQPTVKLTVTVVPDLSTGKDTFTATYAYIDEDGNEGAPSDSAIPFVNRYYVDTEAPSGEPVTHGFTVEKSLTGRPEDEWIDGDRFTAIVEFDKSASTGDLTNVFYKGTDGTYKGITDGFRKEITFTSADDTETFDFRFYEAGTYVFEVTETKGDIPGVTYDSHTYTVTLTVTLVDNTLKVTSTVSVDKAPAESGNTVTLKNTYAASGTWTPTVTKTLTGRDWQADEKFTFTLACKESEGVELPTTTTVQVGQSDTTGVSFGAVTFTKPGEYTFTISETGFGEGLGKGPKPGSIGITVTAVDDNKGHLNLTVTGEGGTTTEDGTPAAATTVNFVNAYSESGSFDIAIAKTLTGRNWNEGESFTFTVTPDDAAKAAIEAEKLNMPTGWTRNSDGTYTVTVTATNNGQGTLTLGNHEGKGATYVFTVTENTKDFDGKHLYCAQPTVTLTVVVEEGIKADGALMIYAYLGESETPHLDTPYALPFTNKYYVDTADPGTVPAGHGFTVEKSLTGRPEDKWIEGDRFTAIVEFDKSASTGDLTNVFYKGTDGTYNGITGRFSEEIIFTNAKKSETFDFRFFEVGTYVFKVKEDKGSIEGVTYDGQIYTVTFNVTKDASGALTVTRAISPAVETDGKIVLKNTYAASGTWTPTVTKTLTGRDWQADEKFTFTLACKESEGVELPTTTTVQVGQGDTTGVSFGAVTFTKPGTYTFTISETSFGEGLGNKKPQGDITLTVTATDNGNGTLNISVTGEGGKTLTAPAVNASTTVTFVNTYDESGSFDFQLSKLLTGRKWTDDDQFTFTITPADDITKAAVGAGGAITVPKEWGEPDASGSYTVTVGWSDAGTENAAGWVTKTLDMGSLTVGSLGGKSATYVFTVTEVTTDFETQNLTCTQPTVKLTVTVVPDLSTGKDTFTATYAYIDEGTESSTDSSAIPFVNRYYVDTADFATHGFTVEKSLTGRDWLSSDVFTATVAFDKSKSGKADNVFYQGEAITDSFSQTVELTSGYKSATLDFRFYEAGTYVFTVKETKGVLPGVAYDGQIYTVTFTVTKDTSGALAVTRSVSPAVTDGRIVFKNVYTPEPVVWKPSVAKEVVGREWATNDRFTFTLTLTAGDASSVTLPADMEITGEIAGHQAAFGDVTFTKAGEYTLTVAEKDPGMGLTASNAVNVLAVVTDDPATGKLSLVLKDEAGKLLGQTAGDSREASATVKFVNTYTQNPRALVLNIQKTLHDQTWQEGESFTFTVTPDPGIPEGALTYPAGWAENSDGSFTFEVGKPASGNVSTLSLGQIQVNVAGTYGFTVREVETPGAHHFYCREPEIKLTVKATVETKDGVPTGGMSVTTTYAYASSTGGTHGGSADGTITLPFDNYAYAVTQIYLRKTLDGRNWGTGEAFNALFELTKAPGYVVCNGALFQEGETLSVPLTEAGAHEDLSFLGAGTYTFRVTEERGRAPGVTYDSRVYIVTVEVTMDQAGRLVAADPVIQEEGVDFTATGVEFTNDYDTHPVLGGLTVRKAVVAETPDDTTEFAFTVTLSDRTITGEYGGMRFENGVAHFTLKNNQVITAVGLPAGTRYTVTEETPAGYHLNDVGETGLIPAEGTAMAHFTNIEDGYQHPEEDEDHGGLTVSTYVIGIGDHKKDWHFSVKLTEKTALMDPEPDVKTYDCVAFHEDTGEVIPGTITFIDGEATFILEHGWHMTIFNLPPEAEYVVHELEAGQEGYTTRTVHTNGSIPHGAIADAVVINDLEPEDAPGHLTVNKQVAGTLGETERRFHFTLTLTNMPDYSISSPETGEPIFVNGVASFTLADGEHRTFTLPVGAEYTVTETEADTEGYKTTAFGTSGTVAAEDVLSATFINTRGAGGLTVTKQVTGNAGELQREFEFTVYLSESVDMEPFNGTNTGTFTLKHGESRTFQLEPGIHYTVTETAVPGYTTESQGATGTIVDGETSVAAFTNDRTIPTGSLTVSKTVTGVGGDTQREWSFRVELDRALTGHYGGMDFTDGVAEFTLKHGERLTALGLPAGVAYTVLEGEANTSRYTTTSTGAQGVIPSYDTVTAAFVNQWHPAPAPRYGSLTVSKTVAGAGGDTQREWSFRVEVSQALNGRYGQMTFLNGVAQFTLKHGESLTAENLPANLSYTVTEIEADTEGYTTAAEGASGLIPSGGTARAAFTNTKDEVTPPDTDPDVPPSTDPDVPPSTDPDTPPSTDPDIPPSTDPDVPPSTDPDVPPSTDPDVPPSTDPDTPPSTDPDTPPATEPDTPPATEPENPPDESPVTGDDSRGGLWLTLMVLSLIGMTATFVPLLGNRRLVSRRGKRVKR